MVIQQDRLAGVLVSGGRDSVCLLTLCSKAHAGEIVVVHFNFHLRGKESVRDEDFVRALAKKNGLECIVFDRPVPQGASLHHRIRQIRDQALDDLACRRGIRHFFTAHHQDDLLETLIMRLGRGTGVKGLQGILPVVGHGPYRLIRPLLGLSRDDINRFITRYGLDFIEDSSNISDRYWRNRIRHHILPRLGPRLRRRLLALAHRAQRLQRKIDLISHHYLTNHVFLKNTSEGKKVQEIDFFSYRANPTPVRYAVLRTLLKKGGFGRQVESRHFDEIERLLSLGRPLVRHYGPCQLRFDLGIISVEYQ